MMNHDREFSKALEDSLYVRVRQALYSTSGPKAMDGEDPNQVASILSADDLIQSKQDGAKDISSEDRSIQYTNNSNAKIVEVDSEEIVEADSEEIVQIEEADKKVHDIPVEEVDTRSVLKGKRNVYVSSEVRQALETLEKAISMVQEHGFHSLRPSSSFANEEPCCMEGGGAINSHSAKLNQLCLKTEASIEVSNSDIPEEASQEEPGINSDIQNFR